MSSQRQPPTAQRDSYYSIEGSAFLNDYSPEIVRTNTLAQKVDGLFKRRKTSWAEIERQSQHTIRPWTPVVDYAWARRYPLRALLPIIGALLELSLLLYLFCFYYTLPADPQTGAKPPRVAQLYAAFPFISCVGSQRLALYQALTICIVILGITSTVITFYFGRDDLLGWQTRRAGLLASVSGAGLGIWVVFAAAMPDRHLHLMVTAVKAIIVFVIKTTGMLLDYYDRSKYPALRQNGAVKFMMWWRVLTLTIAFPLAVMTNVAIFSCSHADHKDIQTPGTKCYRIMALGAPAEWLYAMTTVSWTLTIAFDVYITPLIHDVKSSQDEAEMALLVSVQRGKSDMSAHGSLSPDFVAPNDHEHVEMSSDRTFLDRSETDNRQYSAYYKLDATSGRMRDISGISSDDDEDGQDLRMPMRQRDWA